MILVLLLGLLIAACIAFPLLVEGFENNLVLPALTANCVEGCKSYTKCYAAYNGSDKSGITDMCSSYPGSTDENACNRCKFCQWCPGTAANSYDAKCVSIYEKCPVGKPDVKSDWIDTTDSPSSVLSIFDFTKFFGSYVQPAMDACGANISVWDNLQSGIQNLKYVNSMPGDQPDQPDRPYRPNRRRPDRRRRAEEEEESCEEDSWPEYVSDQHRIADEQQERMATMRSMKKALRNELVDELAKGIAMQQHYEGDCDKEGEDCNADKSSCTQQGKEMQQQLIDMSKYIRKDSIPCHGCNVE
jgi:hypothetical protein